MLTIARACSECEHLGAAFLANVISSWHTNRRAKLNGLVNLLRAGHRVRTASADLGTLCIDDVQASWVVLEEWKSRTR